MRHTWQIGVIGSWRSNLPERSYAIAEEVGREIALRNLILVSGGTTGISDHASKGCKQAGGTTVGVIPASDFREYKYIGSYLDIKICTGTDDPGRVSVLINSCDGVIVIGGGVGTLAEITQAYLQGRPIVVMEGTGEVSDKVGSILDDEGYLDSKKLVPTQFASSAKDAMDKLMRMLESGERKNVSSFGPEEGKRA